MSDKDDIGWPFAYRDLNDLNKLLDTEDFEYLLDENRSAVMQLALAATMDAYKAGYRQREADRANGH